MMIPSKRAASPMAQTEPPMTDHDIDTCTLGCLAGRVLDAAREAHADGARPEAIGMALITLGKGFIAAAHHEPPIHNVRSRNV
jgi:hypothetical protein